MLRDLHGSFTATLTPFRRDGSIDFAYIPRHLRFMEENGMDGVVPSGTNGEAASLSLDERKRVIEETIANKGNLLVIAGTGCTNLPEAVELSRFAESAGADAILVMPPFFFHGATVEGLANYYRGLLDQISIRVLLYNIPQFSGIEITHELIHGLEGYPHLAGVKDSAGDAEATRRFINAFPNLRIFNGSDLNIESATRAGVAGSITGLGNAFPKLVVGAYNESKASGSGSPSQERLRLLVDIYDRYPLLATNKPALSFQGFPKVHVRPPLVDLKPEQEDEFRRELESAGFLPAA